jgi:hypothetical protein
MTSSCHLHRGVCKLTFAADWCEFVVDFPIFGKLFLRSGSRAIESSHLTLITPMIIQRARSMVGDLKSKKQYSTRDVQFIQITHYLLE